MPKFYVSFPQKSPLRHGWCEIVADDKEVANDEALRVFGTSYSAIYREDEFTKDIFRAGRFGEMTKLPKGYKHHK